MINKIYKAGGTSKVGILPNSFTTKTEYSFYWEQCYSQR